jgi:hypothetical protein
MILIILFNSVAYWCRLGVSMLITDVNAQQRTLVSSVIVNHETQSKPPRYDLSAYR